MQVRVFVCRILLLKLCRGYSYCKYTVALAYRNAFCLGSSHGCTCCTLPLYVLHDKV